LNIITWLFNWPGIASTLIVALGKNQEWITSVLVKDIFILFLLTINVVLVSKILIFSSLLLASIDIKLKNFFSYNL